MHRLVVDTNTVISGLLWGGAPRQIIRHQGVLFFSSTAMLDELQGVLHRPKFARLLAEREMEPEALFSAFARQCHLVEPAVIAPTSRDPDDDAVLACAWAAQADMIVSGDDDLLVLKQFRGMPILPSAQALESLARQP